MHSIRNHKRPHDRAGEPLLVERNPTVTLSNQNFAAQLAEDLKPMDYSLDECTFRYLAKIYLGCVWQAAKLLPSVGAVIITNMVMYILLSVTKQADSAAAFGMYLSYN